MKIEINERESYLIDIPEKVNIQELSVIADRFNRLQKLFGKDIVMEAVREHGSSQKVKTYHSKYNWTREKAVEALKIQYSKMSPEEKEKLIMEKFNIEAKKVREGSFYLKKKFNIQPNEVGLIAFRKGGSIKALTA